jgi:hypothetical protein
MVEALFPNPGMTWLEPCAGKGVFLMALAGAGVERNQIVAVDLDAEPSDADSLADTRRGEDFLSWSQSSRKRFDRILGNPPFVSLSRLDRELGDASSTIRIPGAGRTVPFGSNTWFAFLCSSLYLLRNGGSIAFVLPAAWDYADYASHLREHLPIVFRDFFTFRSKRPLFEGVQEGSIIIVGHGYRYKHKRNCRIVCRDRDHLISMMRTVCCGNRLVRPKPVTEAEVNESGTPLGDLIDIRLGGVTGQAEYFLLTETERAALRLPLAAVRPVVSRSRHLQGAVIDESSWLKLRFGGERIWLFRPIGKIGSHPAVVDYLLRPIAEGGCERTRYKIKNRSPWYVTPLPRRVEGFLSGMTSVGPWIALRRMKNLTATNTLYVVRFKHARDLESQSAIALAMLTSSARHALMRKSRHYPDGLVKHEPGDLRSLIVRLPRDVRGASIEYARAISNLLNGDIKDATSAADRFIGV